MSDQCNHDWLVFVRQRNGDTWEVRAMCEKCGADISRTAFDLVERYMAVRLEAAAGKTIKVVRNERPRDC